MSTFLHVRTTMTIPQVGVAIHVAELEELSPTTCRMHRLVALAHNDAVVGAATPEAAHGDAQIPLSEVPHPNTYDSYEGMEAERLSLEDFEALWAEATARFPEL